MRDQRDNFIGVGQELLKVRFHKEIDGQIVEFDFFDEPIADVV